MTWTLISKNHIQLMYMYTIYAFIAYELLFDIFPLRGGGHAPYSPSYYTYIILYYIILYYIILYYIILYYIILLASNIHIQNGVGEDPA